MTGFPQRYIVLDTETTSEPIAAKVPTERLTFRLGCTLTVDPVTFEDDDPHYFEFTERDDFRHLVMGSKKGNQTIYVFAHNMGFDSRIVGMWVMLVEGHLSLLPPPDMPGAGRYKEPLMVTDEYIFIVRTWRRDGQQIVWMDSVQWMKESLESIGEKIRVPKMMQPDADAPDSAWMRYCRGDVDTLHAALQRLWGLLIRHGIDDWDYTPAALSRRFYRMRFERKRIKIPDDPKILVMDRLAYFGGLLECYRVGRIDEPIYQVDINSLYPHVMSQNHFPCEVRDHGDNEGKPNPPDGWRPDESTAEVWIESADDPYPVRGSDQTYYCRGRLRTVLCGPELQRAWERGHIIRIGRWVHYRTEDLFGPWAAYWRKSREYAQSRGDKFADGIIKSLMNALHGKFGQQTGSWEWIGKLSPSNVNAMGKAYSASFRKDVDVRIINGEHWQRSKEVEDGQSFVPIAAWTASYGREYMRWLIETTGVQHVLYVATDSLIVTQDGYNALARHGMIEPGTMGKFKVEGSYQRGAIWNVNQIDLDTSKRRSGVRKGSREIEPGIWSVQSWESCVKGVCLTGRDSVSIETILTRPSLSYSRRQVLDNGTTEPWWIDCWTESPEVTAEKPLWNRLKPRE